MTYKNTMECWVELKLLENVCDAYLFIEVDLFLWRSQTTEAFDKVLGLLDVGDAASLHQSATYHNGEFLVCKFDMFRCTCPLNASYASYEYRGLDAGCRSVY